MLETRCMQDRKKQPTIQVAVQGRGEVTDHPRGPYRHEFSGRWFPSKRRAVITYEHLLEAVEDLVEFGTLPINN